MVVFTSSLNAVFLKKFGGLNVVQSCTPVITNSFLAFFPVGGEVDK